VDIRHPAVLGESQSVIENGSAVLIVTRKCSRHCFFAMRLANSNENFFSSTLIHRQPMYII
jgi:hypothetical protein